MCFNQTPSIYATYMMVRVIHIRFALSQPFMLFYKLPFFLDRIKALLLLRDSDWCGYWLGEVQLPQRRLLRRRN